MMDPQRPTNVKSALNGFLHTSPNFILKFDILVNIAITADIEKAFLMIGIAPEDLHFLWLKNPFDPRSVIIELRFMKLMFGLRPSLQFWIPLFFTICISTRMLT